MWITETLPPLRPACALFGLSLALSQQQAKLFWPESSLVCCEKRAGRCQAISHEDECAYRKNPILIVKRLALLITVAMVTMSQGSKYPSLL